MQITAQAGHGGGAIGGLRRRLADVLAGTPGTLRLVGAYAALGSILFGVLGFLAVSWQSAALDTARGDAAQLVRLQRIHTSLVEADANATNAFLVGGLEPPASRVAYEDGIARASVALADAAAHDGGQAAALGRVNRAISRYTGLVESARANNRQGFPVGVAYLRQASGLLHDDVLPQLVRLVDDGQAQVAGAYSRSRSASRGFWFGAFLALGAALSASGWLAGRTRRIVNLPLAMAALVVGITFVVGALLLSASQRRAEDVRAGPYASAVSLAAARIAAFDAKSAESLTLIARGSGQAFDERFDAQARAAGDQASVADDIGSGSSVGAALASWLDVHRSVRAADEEGRYDQAVKIATGPVSDPASSNGSFRAFDEASDDALGVASGAIADDLDRARTPLTFLRWLVAAAAALASVLAWRGVAARLREYL